MGYFRKGTTKEDRKIATQRIRQHVQKIMNGRGPLAFLPPQICVYRDHTQYFPLFRPVVAAPTASPIVTTAKLTTATKKSRQTVSANTDVPNPNSTGVATKKEYRKKKRKRKRKKKNQSLENVTS